MKKKIKITILLILVLNSFILISCRNETDSIESTKLKDEEIEKDINKEEVDKKQTDSLGIINEIEYPKGYNDSLEDDLRFLKRGNNYFTDLIGLKIESVANYLNIQDNLEYIKDYKIFKLNNIESWFFIENISVEYISDEDYNIDRIIMLFPEGTGRVDVERSISDEIGAVDEILDDGRDYFVNWYIDNIFIELMDIDGILELTIEESRK